MPCGKDWDDLLAYSTLKIVKIRDRRLGFLHYLFMVLIIAYIIGYNIIYQKGYLLSEAPFGATRATLQQPSSFKPATELPYCAQNQTSYNGFRNHPCVYMYGFDVQYPTGLVDTIFSSTRIKDTVYPPTPTGCTIPATTPQCFPDVTKANSSNAYVADIESYTVYIETQVYGQKTNTLAKNGDCKGAVTKGGKVLRYLEEPRQGDIFTIAEILDLAGVSSLDAPSGLAGSATSMRQDGALIVLLIEYSNRDSSVNAFKYRYIATHIPGVDVVNFDPSWQSGTNQITSRNRHGVNIVFLVTGSVGIFSVAALLVSLVSGMVLVKVSSTIVDLLLSYVLPQKALYNKHKYEMTEDFHQ